MAYRHMRDTAANQMEVWGVIIGHGTIQNSGSGGNPVHGAFGVFQLYGTGLGQHRRMGGAILSKHRLLGAVLMPVFVVVAGCTTTTSSPSTGHKSPVGTIVGVASYCPGGPYVSPSQVSKMRISVRLIRSGQTVATQSVSFRTIDESKTYRFSTQPGHYVLATSAAMANIVVSAGHRQTVNLRPNNCPIGVS
jgi:hypothetical protein